MFQPHNRQIMLTEPITIPVTTKTFKKFSRTSVNLFVKDMPDKLYQKIQRSLLFIHNYIKTSQIHTGKTPLLNKLKHTLYFGKYQNR
jgi:hypothetical protein